MVRSVAPEHGWNGVTWSDLDEDTADAAIAAQGRPLRRGVPPVGVEALLRPARRPARAAGRGRTDARAGGDPAGRGRRRPPSRRGAAAGRGAGRRRRRGGAQALVRVHDRCSAGTTPRSAGTSSPGWPGSRARSRPWSPRPRAGRCARVGSSCTTAPTSPASGAAGRCPWRGPRRLRAVVAYRAAQAAAHGFRYVQVDASPDSRPILRRLGFVELATTTPFTHPGGVEPGQGR